ncbi:hypothetical protein [Chitinophaga sp.]|uniref:hypothetical protein n=1 Tax=Chitinophaga sp. TaxID=1869181 RepID=UPI002626A53E|nr:hypothetical protein [uncultured Chitinophaga sp.]
MRKYVVLCSLLALAVLAACKKSNSDEGPRWLENTEKKETIIFKDHPPGSTDLPADNSFYFQFRQMPQDATYPVLSGLYFYRIEGDSILFRNNDQKFYFKMAADGKSFTIGRFFPANGTRLPEKLVFEKQ